LCFVLFITNLQNILLKIKAFYFCLLQIRHKKNLFLFLFIFVLFSEKNFSFFLNSKVCEFKGFLLFFLIIRSYPGKRQQHNDLTGVYTAATSIFNNNNNNNNPNQVSECSNPTQITPLPYVVNWTCEDHELNSSAFNDVFIEDNYNYCTTENDYDSKYGGQLFFFKII